MFNTKLDSLSVPHLESVGNLRLACKSSEGCQASSIMFKYFIVFYKQLAFGDRSGRSRFYEYDVVNQSPSTQAPSRTTCCAHIGHSRVCQSSELGVPCTVTLGASQLLLGEMGYFVLCNNGHAKLRPKLALKSRNQMISA